MSLHTDTLTHLDTTAAHEWDALHTQDNPFLNHAFLNNLEQQQCLGARIGWLPQHLLVRDAAEHLVGALPLYLKTNYFGEFVFDGAWASAYEQNGLNYYPKLVSAIPFSPIASARFLTHQNMAATEQETIKQTLHSALIEKLETQQLSSAHILFAQNSDMDWLEQQGYLRRLQYQYQWKNHSYNSFDDFLGEFRSRKRKDLRKERERLHSDGISIQRFHGNELPEELWPTVYAFYASTFHKKGNYPALTLAFFKQTALQMGAQMLILLAQHEQRWVAGVINFIGTQAMYGRYWGCLEDYDALHFELCFYQGIEYCIEKNLQRFEPGVQGEHKITRGFMPTETWSAHWIRHADFKHAISRFLKQETDYLKTSLPELEALAPFRRATSDND
ncbi:MAG: GNAT family N-acetyltransferase [Gammaproteobacteria bacterium]|nr:GNAT family N-acetyltransferase [Gammaproteobacteria bacterium]